jgi:SpoVK/Ycf46/Vps4 family AAA+-type ATPase
MLSAAEGAGAGGGPSDAGAGSGQVSWDDIGGLDEAKARIEELLVWPYTRAAELRALGVKRPAVGLLLHGPPGTGKTMLARACAQQVRASFIAVELSAIVGAHVGESERTLASLFASARRAAPAILFLDELDALFVGRGGGGGSTDRLTTTLATELDRNADDLASQLTVPTVPPGQQQQQQQQQEGLRGVFVIGATNNVGKIDPSLRSAGRLEAALAITYPGRKARLHIAQNLLQKGSSNSHSHKERQSQRDRPGGPGESELECSGGLGSMVEAGVTAELLADITEPYANSMVVRSQPATSAIN